MKATVPASPNVVVRVGSRQFVRVISTGTCEVCAFRVTDGCGVMECSGYVLATNTKLDWIFVEVDES